MQMKTGRVIALQEAPNASTATQARPAS